MSMYPKGSPQLNELIERRLKRRRIELPGITDGTRGSASTAPPRKLGLPAPPPSLIMQIFGTTWRWWEPIQLLSTKERAAAAAVCRSWAAASKTRPWWKHAELRLSLRNTKSFRLAEPRLIEQGIKFGAIVYTCNSASVPDIRLLDQIQRISVCTEGVRGVCISADGDRTDWNRDVVLGTTARDITQLPFNPSDWPVCKFNRAQTFTGTVRELLPLCSNLNKTHQIHTLWFRGSHGSFCSYDWLEKTPHLTANIRCIQCYSFLNRSNRDEFYKETFPNVECISTEMEWYSIDELQVTTRIKRLQLNLHGVVANRHWWEILTKFPNLQELCCEVELLTVPPTQSDNKLERLTLRLLTIHQIRTFRLLRELCTRVRFLCIRISQTVDDVIAFGDDLFPVPELDCTLYFCVANVRNVAGLADRMRQYTGCKRVVVLHHNYITQSRPIFSVFDTCTSLTHSKMDLDKALYEYLRDAGFMTTHRPPLEYS